MLAPCRLSKLTHIIKRSRPTGTIIQPATDAPRVFTAERRNPDLRNLLPPGPGCPNRSGPTESTRWKEIALVFDSNRLFKVSLSVVGEGKSSLRFRGSPEVLVAGCWIPACAGMTAGL